MYKEKCAYNVLCPNPQSFRVNNLLNKSLSFLNKFTGWLFEMKLIKFKICSVHYFLFFHIFTYLGVSCIVIIQNYFHGNFFFSGHPNFLIPLYS